MTIIPIDDFLNSGAIMSLSSERLFIGWGKSSSLKRDDLEIGKPAFYFSDFFLVVLYLYRE